MSDCRLQLFTNNAVALLDSGITASALSLTVQSGLGNLFPQPVNPGEWFLVTLEDVNSPLTREIIKVIGRSDDTFTIDPAGRGWEGTTPQAWPANDTIVDHRVTAGTLRCLQHDTQFGEPTGGLSIIVGDTQAASTLDTTGLNKTCKWLVTIQTADDRICMFETLAVYKEPPATPIFNIYSKVGDSIKFTVNVAGTLSNMTLTITNTDTSTFTSVDVIRLQHYV